MSNNLLKTVTVVGKLCFFEGKVSDIPYSEAMFWGLLVLMNALMTTVYAANKAGDVLQVAIGVVAHFAILLGGLLVVLSLKKMRNRFHKLVIAFIGTQIIFFSIATLSEWMIPLQAFGIFIIFLGLWELVVQANILKSVLEINMFQAVLLLLLIAMISVLPLLSLIELKAPA